jgi:hypothetical protein
METDSGGVLSARKVVVWTARALSYLLYFYILVVEVILFIGFFLLLFGANPTADFTDWAYRNLDRAMEPFRGIFTPIDLGTTTGNEVASIFETSVLFAMIVYGIVAIAVHSLTDWLTFRLHRLDDNKAEQAAAVESAVAETAPPAAPPAS